MRQPASHQVRESPYDKRFEKLRVPRTWKGVLFVGRAFGHGAVQEMKGLALRSRPCGGGHHHMLRWLKTVVVSDVEKAHEMRQVGIGKTVRSPRFWGSLLTCRYSIR